MERQAVGSKFQNIISSYLLVQIITLGVFLNFFWILLKPIVAQAQGLPKVVAGEFIAKFSEATIDELKREHPELKVYTQAQIKKAIQNRIKVKKQRKLKLVDADLVKVEKGKRLEVQKAIDLMAVGLIDYIEPNYIVSINATPNDTSFATQWGLHNTGQSGGTADMDIDAPEAWNISTGDGSVVVGVIDTGVDYTHADLVANMWVNSAEVAGNGIDDDANGIVDDVYGYNAITDSGDPLDDHNHGTHCAGIIGAVGNNSAGVSGVNWNVKIMALKFLNSSGSGSTADAIKAINYAVSMKQRGVNIRVLSNSWGGSGFSISLQDAISTANNAGLIFTAAAGNDTSNNDSIGNYPSNYTVANVIAVAAVDRNGALAPYSNYGATTVDLAAPGSSILSTIRGGAYASMSGTSMATPFVSGIAAMIFARDSSLTPAQVKTTLINTVQNVSGLSGKMVAPGIVNAYNALMAVANSAPVVTAVADQNIAANSVLNIDIQASDANSDTLSYSAAVAGGDSVATAAFSDARLTITPNGSYAGTFAVTVTVSDGITNTDEIFNVTVAANQAPTLAGIADQYVSQGSGPIDIALNANDPEGNTLTYTAELSNIAVATKNITGNTLRIIPDSSFAGTFNVTTTVSDGSLTASRTFAIIIAAPSFGGPDTDGDGISDAQEAVDGTDQNDSGSFMTHLSSPTYALWNGFLNMTNILELVNVGGTSVNTTISLYAINGSLVYQRTYGISSSQQRDFILNDLSGFQQDSYGLVKITFNGSLDGRMSFYRSSAVEAGGYDFAFAVPLGNPNLGTSNIGFNTFQPSTAPNETNNLVSNWLSIVNLSSSTKHFTILTYDQNGTLQATRTKSVSSFGRVDIDGGHDLLGPSVVGFHQIVPDDSSSAYIAQLVRYGSDAPAGIPATRYLFAFPLIAKAGNGHPMHMPISRKFGETNWVEIINSLNSSVPVQVDFHRSSGTLLSSTSVTLARHAQQHFNVAEILGEAEDGFVTITPSSSNSIIAQSMFYYKASDTGSVLALAGSQAREALGSTLIGSYNLYLGMENWLRLANPTSSSVSLTLNITRTSISSTNQVVIPANGSVDLALHDTAVYGTATDSYGVVTVTTSSAGDVFGELLRLRRNLGVVDYAMPTEVR